MLELLFADLAQTIGWSLADAKSAVRLKSRPTIGDLTQATRDLAGQLRGKEPSAEAKLLLKDLNTSRSRLRKLAETRNATVHLGNKLPTKAELTAQLRDGIGLLRAVETAMGPRS